MANINNKVELFRAIADKTGSTQKEVKAFYNGLIDVIKDTANSQDETHIHLPDLGRINIRVVAPHMGINPKTQEPLYIPTARRTHLKFFPQFTEDLNKI